MNIAIPTIGVSATITRSPMADADNLRRTLPGNKTTWLTGPRPDPAQFGPLGAPVIAGHVAYHGKPAVFARLAELHAGTTLRITLTDGSALTYTVYATRRYPKGALPQSMFAPVGDAELRLVTCARANGGHSRFSNNLIVYAVRTGPS